MNPNEERPLIATDELVAVTGAAGFIGTRVVRALLDRGYRNLRLLTRTPSGAARIKAAVGADAGTSSIEIIQGNLLSRADSAALARDASLVLHLAAGTGTKAFSEAYLNSVVATRNLLDAFLEAGFPKRMVSLSSFSVYSNLDRGRHRLLDETSEVEPHPETRAEAYCYGKVKQDEFIVEFARVHPLSYVILRPGTVFGPGKAFIPGRVGIDSFGPFLHMGGSTLIPLTYVDNCAEAVVQTGLKPGLDGAIFNVVDDDLPSSRRFLRLYKKNVADFRSVYVPHAASWILCRAWEAFSGWSRGQVPAAFTRREWAAYWKTTRFSNRKLKEMVGWTPKIPMDEALDIFFAYCRGKR